MKYFRTILYSFAAIYCGWTVKVGYDEYIKAEDGKILMAMIGFSIATIIIGFLAYREYKHVKSQEQENQE